MTDKVALKILEMEKDKLMLEPEANRDWELITALDIAIEALKNEKPKFITSADERIKTMKHFVHVTINDSKYGEVDGWLDKARQVFIIDAVTTDFAKSVYGWTWKEIDDEQ